WAPPEIRAAGFWAGTTEFAASAASRASRASPPATKGTDFFRLTSTSALQAGARGQQATATPKPPLYVVFKDKWHWVKAWAVIEGAFCQKRRSSPGDNLRPVTAAAMRQVCDPKAHRASQFLAIYRASSSPQP